MKKIPLTIPEGYRYLKEGEALSSGDLIPTVRGWEPITVFGVTCAGCGVYLRKIEIPLVDGWRILGYEDPICRGDLLYERSTGKSEPVNECYINLCAGTSIIFHKTT